MTGISPNEIYPAKSMVGKDCATNCEQDLSIAADKGASLAPSVLT